MGNNLCNDDREEQIVKEEIMVPRAQTLKKTKAENEKIEESPEDINMKVKSIQGPQGGERTRDFREELTESISEIGEMLEPNAVLYLKKSKILNIQATKPLNEEDVEKYNIHKNLVTINPIKLHSNGCIYLGQWNKNRVPEGFGEMIKPDGVVVEGIWKEGEIIKGRIFFSNECYYEGEIKSFRSNNNLSFLPHGTGTLFFEEVVPYQQASINDNFPMMNASYSYSGQWQNGLKHGKGTITFPDETTLTGDFENDTLTMGTSTFIWKDGFIYEGQLNSIFSPNGKGKFASPKGDSYDGDWKDSLFDGFGDYIWADNKHRYSGEYKKGKKDGKGVYYFEYPNIHYKGSWVAGRPHGQGEYHNGDKMYSGLWRYGKIVQLAKEDNVIKEIDGKINEQGGEEKDIKKETNESFPSIDFNFTILKEEILNDMANLSHIGGTNEPRKSVSSPSHKYRPAKIQKATFNPYENKEKGWQKGDKIKAKEQKEENIKLDIEVKDSHNFNQVIHIIQQVVPSEANQQQAEDQKREYDQKITIEAKQS